MALIDRIPHDYVPELHNLGVDLSLQANAKEFIESQLWPSRDHAIDYHRNYLEALRKYFIHQHFESLNTLKINKS